MIVFYMVFAFVVLVIFNFLTKVLCMRLKMDQMKQTRMFRVINMIMVALLVCSYLRVLNVTV